MCARECERDAAGVQLYKVRHVANEPNVLLIGIGISRIIMADLSTILDDIELE